MTELDLRACRLAVLSACESGVSRVHASSEMTGLPASFLIAGAQSVVASLWRVNDTATAILMSYFYAELADQGDQWSPAAALATARARLAQTSREKAIQLLHTEELPPGEFPFAHPVFTDAFVCYGAL
jgi:CHAT domain-containing protein